jgi:hypothetical protein
MKNSQYSGGNARKVIPPLGVAEGLIPIDDMEKRNRDEAAVKRAKVFYAGAKKGFFSREESIEYLRDSMQALESVMSGTGRVKREAQRISTPILKFLDETEKGGSVEICFSCQGRTPPK